jgi:flagellar protein FliO/FliZ
LYLGGEKLNPIRLFWAVCLIACWGFTGGYAEEPSGSTDVLSAPVPEEAVSSPPDESTLVFVSPEDTIILGETPTRGASVSVVIRMVLVLALAAAAVYGVVFFLRRAGRPRQSNNSHLKILSSAHLGSNRFVYVVSAGPNAWLVGAGEGGVSLIAEITDKETVDAMILEDSVRKAEEGRGISNFRALLRRIGRGIFPGNREGAGPDRSADRMRKNRERLKGL